MMQKLSTKFDPSLSSWRTSPTSQIDIVQSGGQLDMPVSDIPDRLFYINIPQKEVPDFNASPETMYKTQNNLQEETHELVVLPERIPLKQERFITLQKWEGIVQQVADDYFVARLVDQTDKEKPDEEAEFMLDEVSNADRDLVKPGSVFYWNVGYEESLGGQRRRSSIIRFRRLPAWSAHEIKTAKNDAERTRDILNWK